MAESDPCQDGNRNISSALSDCYSNKKILGRICICQVLPWAGGMVTVVGTLVGVTLPAYSAAVQYLAIAMICLFAIFTAYLGWRCQVESGMPSTDICRLLQDFPDLRKFSGTPAQFNLIAAKIIYGDDLATLMPSVTDYFSLLVDQNLIRISSVVWFGQNADGSQNTSTNIFVTEEGKRVMRRLRRRAKKQH